MNTEYRQVPETRLDYVISVVGVGNCERVILCGARWIRVKEKDAGLPPGWAIFMSEDHDVSEALQGVPRVYLARHAITRGIIHCGPTAGIPWQDGESGPWTPECRDIPKAAISSSDPPEWVLRRRELGFCRRALEPPGTCPADRHKSADGTYMWFIEWKAGLQRNHRFVVSCIEQNDDGTPIVQLQRWSTNGTFTTYLPGDPNMKEAFLRGPLNREIREKIGWKHDLDDPPVSGKKHPRDEKNEELELELKQAKQELEELKKKKLCVICMEKDRTYAAICNPCMHYCVCAECALKVLMGNKQCPICRNGLGTPPFVTVFQS